MRREIVPPFLLGLICAVLIGLAAQAPFFYGFQVGVERGVGSDRPYLNGLFFFPPEGSNATGKFRWSRQRPGAIIEIPGVGRRGAVLDLTIVSHRAQWVADAPPTPVEVRFLGGTAAPAVFTLRREGAHYHVYVPPHALEDGRLLMELITPGWSLPNDSRDNLGVALGEDVRVREAGGGIVLPDRQLWGWPIGLALFWVSMRLCGFTPRRALLMVLPAAVIVPLLMLISAPRVAYGGPWIVQAGVLAVLTGLAARYGLPPLLRRCGVVFDAGVLRWLALLLVLSFFLKYGTQFYPDHMPGDLQLHVNRYHATVQGRIYIYAQHRGLPFLFPNGLYLMAAPLTLTGVAIQDLFPLLTGLFESSAVLLFYILAARAMGSARLGVLAAAIYALTAGGSMTTWFSFHTQVAAQWAQVALMALLAATWPRWGERRTWWGAIVLLSLAALGHIGTFINLVIWGALVVALLWWRAPGAQERLATAKLFQAGLITGLFTALFYYSMDARLFEFAAQLAGSDLNELTGRDPIPRATSLQVIWQGGLIEHFGFFPVVLAGIGFLLLWRAAQTRRHALIWMLLATIISSISQGILPFITLSSLTTRWLMFASWAIAVAAAPALLQLWRRGLAGRIVSVGMAGYVCWITILTLIDAMALRQPPIEPF